MRSALSVALGVLLVTTPGSAQQQAPEPLPTGDANQQQVVNPVTTVAITSWPATALRYHQWVLWEIKLMQQLVGAPRSPVTQGDVNKVTLRVKDCEASVAADGYVTQNEFKYCERVWNAAVNEIKLQYMSTWGH